VEELDTSVESESAFSGKSLHVCFYCFSLSFLYLWSAAVSNKCTHLPKQIDKSVSRMQDGPDRKATEAALITASNVNESYL